MTGNGYQFTWDVACPHCGAKPGRRCRNRYGNMLKFHVARSRASSSTLKESTMITAETIQAHLVHPVTNAPHMAVCACGEVFYASPGVMTAFETWTEHLADQLNAALSGSAS